MKTMKKIFEKFGKIMEYGKKVLLITHNDMDGSGPVIIAKSVLGVENVDVIHTTNSDMDKTIKETCYSNYDETFSKYNVVFITDISCGYDTAREIATKDIDGRLFLLDHHKTALQLNEFPFCFVSVVADDDSILYNYTDTGIVRKASGTSLFYDMLRVCGDDIIKARLRKSLSYVTHLISGYDTWDWMYVYNGASEFNQLDQLFYVLGKNRFEDSFVEKVLLNTTLNINTVFNDMEKMLLELNEEKIADYCKNKGKAVIEITRTFLGREYSIVFVMAEQHLAELFAYMQELFPDKDIYVICTGNGLSMRTRKDDVDVSDIAKLAGGGGHPQAAGVALTNEIKVSNFDQIFFS